MNALFRRRALLKQLGAAAFLATPVFRSVLAEAQSTAPLRLIMIHFPSGVSMTSLGADYDIAGSTWSFDHVLGSLADVKSDIVIFENVSNPVSELVATFNELEGHGAGMRTMWTSSTNQSETNWGDTTSIDQIVAQAYGSRTRIPNLNLGVLTARNLTKEGQRAVFNNGTWIQPVGDPAALFTRLFPNSTAPAAPTSAAPDPAAAAEAAYLRARGKSRIDQLTAEITSIKGIAGTEEQAKLDLHLTGLRELETSLPNSGGMGQVFQGTTCAAPNVGNPSPRDDLPGTAAAMNELLYQAINCDITRIATMQFMSTGDDTILYPWVGVNSGHHGMEHGWRESDQAKADYDAVQTWLMSQIAVFIKRLKNTPEGNGSMLDNSLVLVNSEMWGEHTASPVIAFIAGKAGGLIRSGRNLDARGAAHSNLLLSIMNTMGLPNTNVGDPKFCSGPLNLA